MDYYCWYPIQLRVLQYCNTDPLALHLVVKAVVVESLSFSKLEPDRKSKIESDELLELAKLLATVVV